ncbi:hypothetical protein HBI41_258040 [Parastagonospora nodorum]|nr:hypothetical protein HBI20_256050 [Parastagonospora nodorum]KAH6243036.1 hypothetical protein HBI41_258040 [Parastagonospora nodorum]
MAFTATLTNVDLLRSIERIQGIKLEDGSSYTVVDSDSALSDMIDTLAGLPVTHHHRYT